MKSFDYYSKVNVVYPKREDFTTTFYYKQGEVVKTKAADHTRDMQFQSSGWFIEKVIDKEKYTEAMSVYHKARADLKSEFKRDLLDELGILGHPKADALFSLAWDRAHSDGYSEVFNEAETLSTLLV